MLITYHPVIDKLLKDVITDLHYRHIQLKLSMTDYVQNQSFKCNGFFDCEGREFAVAIGRPLNEWLRTFIHESCHFDQWKEMCDIWKEYDQLSDYDQNLLWDWIDKKVDLNKVEDVEKTGMTIKNVARITRELERDCEMRTIAKINEYGISLDPTNYAKEAWAYITFYDYILESRSWYVIGKEPYNNEALKALMPDTLYKTNESILTDEMRNIYKTCCEV